MKIKMLTSGVNWASTASMLKITTNTMVRHEDGYLKVIVPVPISDDPEDDFMSTIVISEVSLVDGDIYRTNIYQTVIDIEVVDFTDLSMFGRVFGFIKHAQLINITDEHGHYQSFEEWALVKALLGTVSGLEDDHHTYNLPKWVNVALLRKLDDAVNRHSFNCREIVKAHEEVEFVEMDPA